MGKYKMIALLMAFIMVMCSPVSVYAQIEGETSQQMTISENELPGEATETKETTETTEIKEIPQEVEKPETEAPIEETISENIISENIISEEPILEETISGNTVSDNSLSEHVKEAALEMDLSAQMMQDKKELQGTSDLMEGFASGMDYESNEAVFFADSRSFAEKVAIGYGAELISYGEGVGVIRFEEDAKDIIEMAEDESVRLPAVYPNYKYYAVKDEEVSMDNFIDNPADAATAQSVTVNDEFTSNQYYLDRTGVKTAWNVARGNNVTVAVINTGIYKGHEDIAGKIAGNYNTYTGNFGQTAYNGTNDNMGYGSHIAGIIAATGNNKKGITGVAYGSKIISVKALEKNLITRRPEGSTESIIKAINKAVSSDARVVHISSEGARPYYDALYEAAVNNAVNKGVVVVVAAGDDMKELSKIKPTATQQTNYYSPACFDNVITVSSLKEENSELSDSSNYGDGVIDIAAPGEFILSIGIGYKDDYTRIKGTSQSAAIVAGTAAIILSANPQLRKAKDISTVNMVKTILKGTATDLSNPTYFGAGCVNAAKAVGTAAPQLSTPEFYLGQVKLTNNAPVSSGSGISISAAAYVDGIPVVPTIYYTLDGKNPTTQSTQGTSFVVQGNGAKTLKAMAVCNGKISAIRTIKIQLKALATDVTVTSKTGAYVIGEKKSLQMVATVTPTYTTNKKVKWSIPLADEAYAQIDQKGKLTAKVLYNGTQSRTITVRATTLDGSVKLGEAQVTIYPLTTQVKATTSKMTLDISDHYTMQVSKAPLSAADLTFVSSKPSVATVDPVTGEITAVAAGKAKITAKAVDGSGKSASMEITVKSPTVPVIPVTEITVTTKNNMDTVASGKTIQMIGTVNQGAANKKVTWSVDVDKNIATINSKGLLTAKSKITTQTDVTVTATSVENPTVIDTMVIHINPITTGITMEKSATLATTAWGSLAKGIRLNVTSSPAGTLDQYTYTSSNVKVATVDSTGYVTALKAGSVTITAKAKDGSGKIARCAIKVVNPVTKITVSSKTGYPYVGIGRSIQLAATVNSTASNKEVTWSVKSGDVTVDAKGKVTGQKSGTAVITATAKDGTNTYRDYTVTVRTPIEKLYFAKTQKNTDTMTIWRTSIDDLSQIDYVMRPFIVDGDSAQSDVYETMTVTNSNGNVLQLIQDENVNGKYYLCGVNKGTAKITFTTNDGVKKTATITVKVK